MVPEEADHVEALRLRPRAAVEPFDDAADGEARVLVDDSLHHGASGQEPLSMCGPPAPAAITAVDHRHRRWIGRDLEDIALVGGPARVPDDSEVRVVADAVLDHRPLGHRARTRGE